ncbi:MAG: histidine phosphatase family protein [Phycisphaerales bacterium]|jgi:broad specificity phosphatase PhoE|nr:histidine phosphatase family protein [Phycisphaerales bacterium]
MGKPSGYTIYLLRAGETSWDAESRVVGETDLPMTDLGSDSVIEAIRTFEPQHPISLVLTSEEETARRSAKLLIQSAETKLKSSESLNNIGMGLWEGVLQSELEERCPSAYNQWKDAPERITPPEGESLFEAQDRLIGSILKLISKTKGDHPSIALVLRPWAWAIVRCWLNEQKICEIWDQLDEQTCVESFELTKSQVESYQRRSKAGV